jgi:hypothetical protein
MFRPPSCHALFRVQGPLIPTMSVALRLLVRRPSTLGIYTVLDHQVHAIGALVTGARPSLVTRLLFFDVSEEILRHEGVRLLVGMHVLRVHPQRVRRLSPKGCAQVVCIDFG